VISDAELTAMQAVVAETRTQAVDIQRPEVLSDNAGGTTTTWVTIAAGVLARISPQGMQPWEKIDRIEGRVVATSVWNIWLPPGQDITAKDRIVRGEQIFNVISGSVRSVALETKVQAVLLG
jgi:head-tail adaptor